MIHKDGLAPLEAFVTEVADVRGFACKAMKTVSTDENRVKTVTKNNENLKTVFFKKEEIRSSFFKNTVFKFSLLFVIVFTRFPSVFTVFVVLQAKPRTSTTSVRNKR